MTSVRVSASSRLHLGLMDLGGSTRRRYGGGGFSLNAFPTCVTATTASVNGVSVGCGELDARALAQVHSALVRLQSTYNVGPVEILVHSMPPSHVGLGSKTAILLSVLSAASLAGGLNLRAEDLVRLSGRGGASGIGVHAFFCGGFVVDAGHPAAPGEPYLPSSMQEPVLRPPLSIAKQVPESWRFHLILPRGTHAYSQDEERAMFAKSTPVPKYEVLAAIAALYHGIVPAVALNDLALLSESLADLHRVGFKRRELVEQEGCQHLYSQIVGETELAVGLSSMGPLLYVVSRSGDHLAESKLLSLCRAAAANYLGCFSAATSGHEVNIDAAPTVS